MKVLIIKISSMGDLIHTLPAVSDATQHIPNIQFDWVADRAFAEIPNWHPSVNQVMISSHRHWKHNILTSLRNGEIKAFLKKLRNTHYDLVIDAQSSLKSAILSRFAKAKSRAGMCGKTTREWGAHWFYQHRYTIDKQQHAVERTRALFAKALNYDKPSQPPIFGIALERLKKPKLDVTSPYVVLIPNASWQSKRYPEQRCKEFIDLAVEKFHVLIPWGNEAEKNSAERISGHHPKAHVLPRISLSEWAYLIKHSSGTVSVDTGLGHLSAALGVAGVSLYGSTSAKLIGKLGANQCHLQADIPCMPCYKRECHYKNQLHKDAVCMDKLSTQTIWQQLCQLNAKSEKF